MSDDGSPSRRIYAWRSGFTLTASNLDIPVNSKEPLVWLNIANNTTISGGASATTGTDVTVRNNGVGPDLIVHYGDAESFPLLDCSWVRILGNTANVTFYLSDEYIPIRPRPTWGGSTGVVSLTSANAGLTVAPASGAVVITLAELDFGTLWGTVFSPTGTSAPSAGAFPYFGGGAGWVQGSVASGAGISVSNGATAITITNTGVTSNVAGNGITVSGATGAVTVSAKLNGTTLSLGASGLSLNLGNANEWTAGQTYDDGNLILKAPTLGGLTTLHATDSASNFGVTFLPSTGTVPVVVASDIRAGLTSADGAPITVLAATGSKSYLMQSSMKITTGSAQSTYVIKWTEAGTVFTITDSNSGAAGFAVGTATITPDNGTNVTAQITLRGSGDTLSVACTLTRVA